MATTHVPLAAYKVTCTCGAQTRIPAHLMNRLAACPTCSKVFRPVLASDEETGKVIVKVLDPMEEPPPPPRERKDSENLLCSCGNYLVVSLEDGVERLECPACGEAYSSKEGSTVILKLSQTRDGMLCPCGRFLKITPENWGQKAQCPSCGVLMNLEKIRDPQTLQTYFRATIIGYGRPRGESWSLEDFQ